MVSVVFVVALMAAFVPRTVAEGGRGAEVWRLRVAPGIVSPSLRFDGPDGTTTVSPAGAASLGSTTIWQVGSGAEVDTIVAGPTPPDAGSIRVTSVERGVGEAAIERVLWSRVHVAVIAEAVTVTDLVAIGRDGQVVEVVPAVSPPRPSEPTAPPPPPADTDAA